MLRQYNLYKYNNFITVFIALVLLPITAWGVIVVAGQRPSTVSASGESSTTTTPATNPTSLDVTLFSQPAAPIRIDPIGRGERFELALHIRNPGDSAVELGKVEKSCECFEVVFDRRSIEPGGTTTGTFILDFRQNPTFVGGLLLTAEVSTAEPTPRNAVTVRLSVDVK
jgi:hypothetical protein